MKKDQKEILSDVKPLPALPNIMDPMDRALGQKNETVKKHIYDRAAENENSIN